MIIAVDTSALLAIWKGDKDAPLWVDLLAKSRKEGQLRVCEVVYAEIASLFPVQKLLHQRLDELGLVLEPISAESAFLAGQRFDQYRRDQGPRRVLIADFLVAAHALTQTSGLAGRDRGYLHRYFPDLKLLDPTAR